MAIVGTQTMYINVSDLNRSVAFYEKLGLQRLQEVVTPGNWSVLRAIGMPPDAQARIAIMILKDGRSGNALINLVQWLSPASHGQPTHLAPHSDLAHIGLARFALRTTNLLEEYARLSADGVTFLSSPEEVPEVEGIDGGYVVCAVDPDGAIIQLIQI